MISTKKKYSPPAQLQDRHRLSRLRRHPQPDGRGPQGRHQDPGQLHGVLWQRHKDPGQGQEGDPAKLLGLQVGMFLKQVGFF